VSIPRARTLGMSSGTNTIMNCSGVSCIAEMVDTRLSASRSLVMA
jgi:hypothetical protein